MFNIWNTRWKYVENICETYVPMTTLIRYCASALRPSPAAAAAEAQVLSWGRGAATAAAATAGHHSGAGFAKELKKDEKFHLLFLQHVTPVFGREPTQVICPGCQVKKNIDSNMCNCFYPHFLITQATVKTRVSDESGLAAWLACLGLCFFG